MGADKEAIRRRVWDDLEERGVARFPFPPHGRIPNFAGAADAADRLADTPEWEGAERIKANPDAPQLPVRRRALRAGKTLYMAVPRLREAECFIELDPRSLEPEEYDPATTVSGIGEYGEQVGPDAMAPIDLIVSGSVAVDAQGGDADEAGGSEDADGTGGDGSEPGTGARIGKGEGYSDLEFALARELGLVDGETPVATTVHERQLVAGIEPAAHDVPMDLAVTPERAIRPDTGEKPVGIDWDRLDEERISEIPVLEELR
ncbi:5-formyltetrahydrofolate cyclo-ligase [Saliphagus sp. LR7]|uniref:5-formyltetrahydrofolate cyclo-ligase n=1 Tax=Saliphagus sp. LR7 TaxID=2282654 RepID=UPI000DF754E3|nr:5-formyltetrahydrofolate cyclo-ligase [Saliphagus sp. LR7]